MNLEGRKFHFARDDEDGRIYAQYEIETEVANCEGWILPPKKGDTVTETLFGLRGTKAIKLVWKATGELEAGFPVYLISLAESDFGNNGRFNQPESTDGQV